MSELAGPNDPLVLRDGRRIDVTTGRVVRTSAVSRRSPASNGVGDSTVNTSRRRIQDTGIQPAALSSLLAVAAFKLCNFDPLDIIDALGTSSEMLDAVEKHSEYDRVVNMLVDAVEERMRAEAKGVLMASATDAANVLVDDLDDEDVVLRQSAAKDILNRAGVGSGHDGDGSGGNLFRIEIVDKQPDGGSQSISIKVGV